RDDPFGDQDRILEIIAVPRHERAQDVTPERQFAELGRGPVGDNVAGTYLVADLHQRPLVDAGVLVRPLELQQVVDVDAGGRGRDLLGGADHDAGRVDLVDDARAAGDDRHAGIAGDGLLHAGADERRLGAD